MRITKQMLKDKGACRDGLDWFERHFPRLDVDYQELLNKLAELGGDAYAHWLLDEIGASNEIVKIDSIDVKTSCFFAGSVIVKKSVKVGKTIRAGASIQACWSVEAGEDYGVYAGLRVKVSEWPLLARIVAETKPDNLISGHWVDNTKETG